MGALLGLVCGGAFNYTVSWALPRWDIAHEYVLDLHTVDLAWLAVPVFLAAIAIWLVRRHGFGFAEAVLLGVTVSFAAVPVIGIVLCMDRC